MKPCKGHLTVQTRSIKVQVKKSLANNSFATFAVSRTVLSFQTAFVCCVSTASKIQVTQKLLTSLESVNLLDQQCMSCGKNYKRGFKLNKKKQFQELLKPKLYQEIESVYLQAQKLPPGEIFKLKVVHKIQLQVESQNDNKNVLQHCPPQIQATVRNDENLYQSQVNQSQLQQQQAVGYNINNMEQSTKSSNSNKNDLINNDELTLLRKSERAPLRNLSNIESQSKSKAGIEEKQFQQQHQVQNICKEQQSSSSFLATPPVVSSCQEQSQPVAEYQQSEDLQSKSNIMKSILLQTLVNINTSNRRQSSKNENCLRQARSLSPEIKVQSKLQFKPKNNKLRTKLKREFEKQITLIGKKRKINETQIEKKDAANLCKQSLLQESSKSKKKELYKNIRYPNQSQTTDNK
ncbi:UNKNOWN [Stylonychia lemnae]|uniref:Uncharacterized protein n=1 Tax=Stylonychia lemnae TaxID=5949 RepID=A0A078AJD7_STYLE|nr:UNKNOWN [Stylonychia lemnae]|eukprot:CDW80888.1 UNKNOWN [Stylonychia lemnae]